MQEKMIMLGIFIGALVGAVVALERTRGARYKQYIAEGRQHGRGTAESIGVEKAYRIAETLPDCPYRDGYTQGVAEVEDEAK